MIDRLPSKKCDFIAVDVETASSIPGTICQLGLCGFLRGQLEWSWQTLVNPEATISAINYSIHGIAQHDVESAPTWDRVVQSINALEDGVLLASHTLYDRQAIQAANHRYSITPKLIVGWIDTCRIARLAWPELPSHSLPKLARHFNIRYKAHNAVEDARCAGEVLLRAVRIMRSEVSWAELAKPNKVWFQ